MGPSRPSSQTAEHWVLASAPVDDGYQLTCACGWLSAVVVEPLRLFDAWALHVTANDA